VALDTAEPPLAEAARRAARLGVLGGSFDPPHTGHLHAARAARAAFALDHVVFVPAARPPHKPERVLADARDRLALLALLLGGDPGFSIWGAELARGGPSYTVDTLRELAALVPAETRLFLVVGADNLPGFPRWRAVEEIVRLAQPVIVTRDGLPADAAAEAALPEFVRTRIAIGRLASRECPASSTELREALARGACPPGLLPDALREYVAVHRLYRER
jgi:nicotinate-nucleotide adenylyltransferase